MERRHILNRVEKIKLTYSQTYTFPNIQGLYSNCSQLLTLILKAIQGIFDAFSVILFLDLCYSNFNTYITVGQKLYITCRTVKRENEIGYPMYVRQESCCETLEWHALCHVAILCICSFLSLNNIYCTSAFKKEQLHDNF